MNKYPIRYLPLAVREAFNSKLLEAGLVNELPHAIAVTGKTHYSWYLPPKPASSAFTISINLQSKEAIFSSGDYEGQYASRPVDRDKTKRVMEKGQCIVKGYLSGDPIRRGINVLSDVEIIFHPSQNPRHIPELTLEERERRILFCFGSLKDGITRKEALHRLNVSQSEIDSLVTKGLLKKINNGHAMTIIGEANRLRRPMSGEKIIVDQW